MYVPSRVGEQAGAEPTEAGRASPAPHAYDDLSIPGQTASSRATCVDTRTAGEIQVARMHLGCANHQTPPLIPQSFGQCVGRTCMSSSFPSESCFGCSKMHAIAASSLVSSPDPVSECSFPERHFTPPAEEKTPASILDSGCCYRSAVKTETSKPDFASLWFHGRPRLNNSPVGEPCGCR